MTRIAHLSDLHLVERGHAARSGLERMRLHYLSLGRAIDFDARVKRVRDALRAAIDTRPDHVCITGDLTEDGTDAQFEVLAEVLDSCGMPADRITLVPGNHDGYQDLGAFNRALKGPLSAYRGTSSAGAITVHDDAVIVPVSTLIPQSFTRSAGAVDVAQLARLESLAADRGLATRALVVAQHHPPMRHLVPGMQWIDGLVSSASMRHFVEQNAHVHVLHGHTHIAADRVLAKNGAAQAFCVPAVVEHGEPVRVYEASAQRLRPQAAQKPWVDATNVPSATTTAHSIAAAA